MHGYGAIHSHAGLLKLTHKGLLRLSGGKTEESIALLLCGDVRRMPIGSERFSPMLNPQGGIMDAVQVLHMAQDEYWMIYNRSNREKILRHMQRQLPAETVVAEPQEQVYALLGPLARTFLQEEPAGEDAIVHTQVCGVPCIACRMVRLGVDGFFLITKSEQLVSALQAHNVLLYGSAALDMLMLEAGMPAYGREMDDTINPLETGLSRHVHLQRPGFIGREALVAAGEPRRTLVGLVLAGSGAQPGMTVIHRDKPVGEVTSACFAPGVNAWAALALVETPYQDAGRRLMVEQSADQLIEGRVAALPLKRSGEDDALS